MHERQAQVLSSAIIAGDVERVRVILDGDPAIIDGEGREMSPLATAIYTGQREIIELLLLRGATVDIFLASALGAVGRVRELLDEEPDLILSFSDDGWTPLHLAAYFGSEEVGRLLLERKASAHARSRSREGNTPLHSAVAGRQPQMVDLLIARGTDVDAADADGWTPINLAAHEGVPAMVQSLLAAGADSTLPSNSGQTPRQTAEMEGHSHLLPLLSSRD